MAADWSELPAELLHLISERLDSPLDLLRFRSVCSTWWRSSSPHIPIRQFPFNFPPIPAAYLSKRSLFLIKPPPHRRTRTPWLVKIGQDSCGRNRLLHPLFRDRSFPTSYPRVLDFTNLLASHLGNELVFPHTPRYQSYYTGKVAVDMQQGSVLLKIHEPVMLAQFRCGDDELWTSIPAMTVHSYWQCHDACAFNGRFYAVGGYGHGRTIVIGPDSVVEELVADRDDDEYCCKNKKCLVESNGELLLVVKHWRYCKSLKHVEIVDFEGYEVGRERAVMFQVFRLEENERRWVKVKSLGDRVLFLADNCSFSASASDLGIDGGNCVVFADDAMESHIGVLSLDEGWCDGWILRLSNYPGYSKLFWPPPDWVMLH